MARCVNLSAGADVLCNMARLQNTDEELIRELYAEFGTALLRYVTGLVAGDRTRAEDIVQETLLRAWKHPEVLTGHSPRPWLFAVARNLVIDDFRARSARPAEASADVAGVEASTDGGISAALTRFELQDALASLPPQHREALVAVYYRDLSIAQAAHRLGVPEGTVKSRCYYALRALRVLCDERGLLS